MTDLKGLVKPPFANYDVVVYFGAGLFCLPFFRRYVVVPGGIGIPEFLLSDKSSLASEIISVLSGFMFVYVAGHLIAYLASQFIEKTIDRFLGKVSTAIIVSAQADKTNRNKRLREFIRARVLKIREDRALTSSIIRGIFHFPNYIQYFIIYKFGIFGYLDTRLPKSVLEIAGARYTSDVDLGQRIATDVKWYKGLEYYVINRAPAAVSRMYNYLVIAGLFRSLSFVFLMSAWGVIINSLFWTFGWSAGLSSNKIYHGPFAGCFEWGVLSTLSVFCILAYMKFQRRYAEEAIFALAFSPECDGAARQLG